MARHAAALIAIACACACAAPRRPGEPAAEPMLELVESSPIETALDHPDLRDAFEVWPAMIGGARRSDVRVWLASAGGLFLLFAVVSLSASRLAMLLAGTGG